MDTLLRLKQVLEATKLSKTGLYQMIRLGAFPRQRRLAGGRSVCWNSRDVQEWIASRPLAHPNISEAQSGSEKQVIRTRTRL